MTNTFLAAGENGTCLLSTDGKLWKAVRTGKDGEVFNSTCIASGRAVTSARYGGRNTFTTSTDGTTWKDSEFDAKYSKYIRGLFHFKDQFHAVGGDGELFALTSPDGIHWSEPKSITGKHTLRRYAMGNGMILGVGDYGRRSVVSFRQACLTQFSGLGTLVGFLFEEDNHGWTKAWRHSEGSGTWAGSV